MRNLLLLLTFALIGFNVLYGQGTTCANMEPICTDDGLNFTANSGGEEASTTDVGNDYDCLSTQPNPTWYYLEIATDGDLLMSLTAGSDIDYVIYGPFSSLSVAQANCGDLGNPPANNVVDCSYSSTANESPEILGAVTGEVYVMLITNYADVVQDITLSQTGGTASTNCSIVTDPPCSMTALDVTVGGCDFATNEYAVSGTIYYENPPTSGSLIAEDCNGNQVVVDTYPFAAGPQNFNLTGLNSDGNPCTITAYFTGDPTCTQTYNYTAPVCVSNCPSYDLQATSATKTCGNQIYYLEIQNSACDGFVQFTVTGQYDASYGSEITWQIVSNATGNVVASGTGTSGGTINVTVGPLDPNVEGTIFNLVVNDSWGDGFSDGGWIQVNSYAGAVIAGPISGDFGSATNQYFQAGMEVSSSTITVNTPSGIVTSSIGACQDHEVGMLLENTNFCTPISVDLPWTITCDNSGTTIASGTHTVTVYPSVPTDATDVVSVTWNSASCEWEVSANNDCDQIDIGSIFTISPDPSSISAYCSTGDENFSVSYVGLPGSPNCCLTAGATTNIVYNSSIDVNDFVTQSAYGGSNNSAYGALNGSGNGGNATSFDITIDGTGFCYPDGPNGMGTGSPTEYYYIDVYINGVQVLFDGPLTNPDFLYTLTEADLPAGVTYNENSVIDVYVLPNNFSYTAGFWPFDYTVYTNYVGGISCSSLGEGEWTLAGVDVTVDATYEQVVGEPVICDFPLTAPYQCCDDALIISGNAPADVSVQCIADVPPVDINSLTGVSSLCPVTVTHLSDVQVGTCPITITRTYRMTNDCGGQEDVVQIITVNDTQNPTASDPTASFYECLADVPAQNIAVVTDEADNCTVSPTVAFVSESQSGTCPIIIERIYSVTDDCNNTIQVTHTITVEDTEDPTASNQVSFYECMADVPAQNTAVINDEADNCTATPTVAFVSESQSGTCPIIIERIYSVTDDCNNSIQVTHTITVEDTEDPTASNPTASFYECMADVPAQNIAVVTDAADNCTATPTVAFVSESQSGTCPIIIERIYRVTDDCNNSIQVTHTITVEDTEDPTASNPTASFYECMADVPAQNIAVVTDAADNCTATPTVAFVSESQSGTCPIVIERIYSVTDDCNNSIQVTHTITVEDTEDPTASNPTASFYECMTDVPAQNTAVVTDELDNCTATPTVAFVSESQSGTCPIVIERIYSVTDDCNNSIQVTHTITVEDTQDPTASNPTASFYDCIGDVPAQNIAVVTDAADNCTATPTVAFVSESQSGTCPIVIERIYSVTDDCNNSIQVTHTITVDDNTIPSIVGAPTPSNVEGCDASSLPAAETTVAGLEALGLTISDNCTANIDLIVTSNDVTAGTCPLTVTRTYTIEDACGNQATVDQTLTVDDTTDPVIVGTIPDSNLEGCDATSAPAAETTVAGLEGLGLTISDNCTADIDIIVTNNDVISGTCPVTITRTYTIEDACGNQITVDHLIYIDDTTDPTASNPGDISLVSGDPIPNPDPAVVADATDNCSAVTVTHVDDVSDFGNCPEIITRTYKVEDVCGNFIEVQQLIIIGDAEMPTASNPLPISEECIGDVPAPDPAVVSDEADNGNTPSVAWEDDTDNGLNCPKTIDRRYRVTDDCGNFIFVTQTITILDVTDPVSTGAIADSNVEGCDATSAPAAETTVAGLEGLGLAISDNCTADVDLVVTSSDVTSGTCPLVITRTYTIEDACGNQTTTTHTINIDDTTVPSIVGTVPDSNIEGCDATSAPGAETTVAGLEGLGLAISDNCTADVDLIVTSNDVTSGTCPLVITRTYTIEDACGNQSTVDHIIYIDDTTDPVIVGSIPDSNIEGCDATSAPAAETTVAALEGLGLTISDNCTADIDLIVSSSDASAGTCPLVVTRTYTIIDACGNQSTVDHIINIDDTTPPTASNPADMSVGGGNPVPNPDPTVVIDEADNCTLNPTVTWVDDQTDGGSCPEIITRTYEIEDACGNTSQVQQLIYIGDAIIPTASNPLPITVECIADIPAPNPAVVTDASDNGVVTVSWEDDTDQGDECPKTILRRYRVEDDCFNFIFVTQTITILPATNPVVPGNGSSTVECLAAAQVEPTYPVITDVCGNTIDPVVTAPADIACEGDMMWVFTFTDCAGNESIWNYTYTIDYTQGITAPVATTSTVECPADATDPGAPADIMDACGRPVSAVLVGSTSTPDPLTCEGQVVWTYRYTACDGSTADWTHTYTIDYTQGISAPMATTSTVECPADATDPGAPADIMDACGRPVSAVLIGSTSTPDPVACEGQVVWTYRYTGCDGSTADWTHTYTIDYTQGISAPIATTSTVECPADATDPGAPADIMDACGRPVSAVLIGSTSTPDPVTCEGQVIWTYRYTGCDGSTADWTHTYTIDYTQGISAPMATTSTVECPADATDPGAPADIMDACGRPVSAVLIGSTSTPDPVACEGQVVWTYRYTGCDGSTADWTHTYTIDYTQGISAPMATTSTVECPADAIDPGVPADIMDACGRPVSAVLIGSTSTPDPVTCEGQVVWTYRYTGCDGSTADWTHTYNVVYTQGISSPLATISTVECPADATDPGAPADIMDACGRLVSAVLIGSTSTPDPLTCEGQVVWTYRYTGCDGSTADWTHTYTIDYTQGISAPMATTSTVECPADATDPGAPADIMDACGRPVSAVLIGSTSTPDPVSCEGQVVWTYRYTGCDGSTADWTHTYTIDYTQGISAPMATTSTVECPADATDPGAPADIMDACGRPVSAVLIGSTSTPDPVTCEGQVVWTYRYTGCDGSTADWTHTYTIDYTQGISAPMATTSTVECPADATDPGAPADIMDACGRLVSAVLIGSTSTPDPVTCEGQVIWTYRYTGCDGSTADWTHTYTIDYTQGISAPMATTSTVECPADATDPGAPADIMDACGRPVSAVLIGSTSTPDPVTCEGQVVWTYRYTGCDGSTADWTHTYTIDLPSLIVPVGDVESVVCINDIYVPTAPVVYDACHNQIVPVMTEGADPVCSGSKVYTFTYTDCSGAQSIYTYTFNINDNVAPTASNPTPISVVSADLVPAPDVSVVTDEADNCTLNPIVAWESDISDGNVCSNEVITRTYSVTDDCGNVTYVTQSITITAVPAPIDAGPNVTICEGESTTLTAINPWNVDISWSPSNPPVDGVPFTPTATTTYTVTADNYGCFSTDQVTVTVEPIPTVSFMADNTDGCEPLIVNFTSTSTGGNGSQLSNCIWEFSDGTTANGCDQVSHVFDNGGLYDVTLTTTSINGCTNSATYTDYIYVEDLPIASFEPSQYELSNLYTDVDFQNNSEGAVNYQWNFGDGSATTSVVNPSHTYPDENGGYTVQLIAYSELGCSDTTYRSIRVTEEVIYYVPNTFTPDGDNFNQYFKAVFYSGYDPYDYNMLIFNRWGEVIWESNDSTVGWDGTYGGIPVQDGTYSWKIEFKTTATDERKFATGHVNVMR